MLFDRPKTPTRPVKVFSLRPKVEDLERRYYDTDEDVARRLYNANKAETRRLYDANKDAARRYYDTDEDIARRYWGDVTSNQPWSAASDVSTLVHRPKEHITDRGFVTDSASEDEGFSIVRRPKQPTHPFLDDAMSSPEIIPTKSIDVLAATGSNYPDDDEWTML
jgi:hypothetical protein